MNAQKSGKTDIQGGLSKCHSAPTPLTLVSEMSSINSLAPGGYVFKALVMLLLLSSPVLATEVAQYNCTIGGVYENKSGKLVQRPNDKAIGQQLYVNADTGEVTGYFGTDGASVREVRRPDGDGILTIETVSGVLGDAANRLSVSQADEVSKKHPFVYTKNWLIISGLCSSVIRHD